MSDTHIKCFLDGKLIHDVTYPRSSALYAVASRTPNRREAILKVVNVSREMQQTRIRFTGAALEGSAKAILLSSDQPEDENSLEQPQRVAPVTRTFTCSGAELSYDFPPNSVTVLRLPMR